MEINAAYIHAFYNSHLGKIVEKQTKNYLSKVFLNYKNDKIAGLGFTTPYISYFNTLCPNSSITEMYPDFLGGIIDENKPYKQKAVNEYFLPIEPATLDMIFFSHLLELVEKPQSVIEEAWRVLKPNGIIISITPRRAGIWTRYDNNPFGFGRSFSSKQLNQLLSPFFYTEKNFSYLYTPPWKNFFNIKLNNSWESIGSLIIPFWGGLKINISKKILYAKNSEKSKKIRIKESYAAV